MAATYAWLADQERAATEKRNKATRRWVQQQHHSSTSRAEQPVRDQANGATNPATATPRVHTTAHPPHPAAQAPPHAHPTTTTTQPPHADPHTPADRKKRPRTRGKDPEEERQHHERRLELQHEFERMEARWRGRETQETKVRAEYEKDRGRRERERERAEAEKRAREHVRKLRAEEMRRAEAQRMRDTWTVYERRWAAILSGGGGGGVNDGEVLSFWNIPWPLLHPPRSVHDITPASISSFILSASHSEGIPRRERVREALRRWHPDRFGRLKGRVRKDEWDVVEWGVGVVVRCLNRLLELESLSVGIEVKGR